MRQESAGKRKKSPSAASAMLPKLQNGPVVADLLKRDANIFDALRLLAAIAVIYSHSFALSGRHEPVILGVTIGGLAVYVFFILSGLLISASWVSHPRVAAYLGKRILRILPALVVAILLAAFVLGPIMTDLGLRQYFSSNQTYQYLNGISLFNIVYQLPGVFQHNIYGPFVNGSIWTLPYEFLAYLGVAFLGKLRKLTDVHILVPLFLGCIALFFVVVRYAHQLVIFNLQIYNLLLFTTFFVAGAMLYVQRDKVVLSWLGAGLCLVVLALAQFVHHPLVGIFLALPYLVLFIGSLTWTGLHRLSSIGDFSYGMYIFAWPVQQVIVSLHHNLIGPNRLFVYATLITFVCSFASWHLVEKRALRLKSHFNLEKYPVLADAW